MRQVAGLRYSLPEARVLGACNSDVLYIIDNTADYVLLSCAGWVKTPFGYFFGKIGLGTDCNDT
jgi:hypothetical protein